MAMLTPQEENAIRSFQDALKGICGAWGWEVRLFGSRARGHGGEDSDLDLLVLLDHYEEATKLRIWDAAYHVFSTTDILLSPLVIARERFEQLKRRERLVAQDIEREGIRL
ncbi:MAG: nucleotidyltransferase domain-containing protein [Deltaproteobacteria bacterium]|nr:nucleotidyltransferase domain-containing protein [Deltaproteobacteria bacterium]